MIIELHFPVIQISTTLFPIVMYYYLGGWIYKYTKSHIQQRKWDVKLDLEPRNSGIPRNEAKILLETTEQVHHHVLIDVSKHSPMVEMYTFCK